MANTTQDLALLERAVGQTELLADVHAILSAGEQTAEAADAVVPSLKE